MCAYAWVWSKIIRENDSDLKMLISKLDTCGQDRHYGSQLYSSVSKNIILSIKKCSFSLQQPRHGSNLNAHQQRNG